MSTEAAIAIPDPVTTEGVLVPSAAAVDRLANAIVSKKRLDNQELREVKTFLEAELGKPNTEPVIDKTGREHPAGTLRVKAVSADGGPHRWRVFIEWEPHQ